MLYYVDSYLIFIKRLLSKSQVASSLFYTLSNRILIVILNLASFLILVRFFSEEQMGIWAIFLSITTIFEAARGAFIKPALIRMLNNEGQHNSNNIQSAGLLLNFLTAITITLLSIIIILVNNYIWKVENLSLMVLIYVLTSFTLTFFFHVEFILQAKSNFRFVFQMYLLKQFIFLLLIIFFTLVYEGPNKLIGSVILQLISILFSTLFALYVIKPNLKIFQSELSWIKKLWQFGKFVLATNLNSLIFRNTDHFMIAAMISPTAVAYYNVAIRITNFLDLPSTAASEALFPKSVMLSHSSDSSESKKLFEVTVGVIIAFLIPFVILIFLFSELTITLIAGNKYIEATPVLQITLFYSLLLPFYKQFGMFIDSLGEPKVNTKLTVVLSIGNFFFNYFLIKSIGLNGAAYGTLLTYTFASLFSVYFLNKKLGVSPIGVFKEILATYILVIDKTKLIKKKILKS